MPAVRRSVALLTATTIALAPVVAAAGNPGECHVVDVDFQPAKRADLSPGRNPPPQIVVWVEDTAGNYIDTIFITKQTGTHGLGNRPGRFDFNSGPLWPYGRRITVFPVWAERKRDDMGQPLLYDRVEFQNSDENNLSHPFNQSSRDTHFCRPMQPLEPSWDALTCASPNATFTDKGYLSSAGPKSKYPPRQDIQRSPGMDSESVSTYAMLNTFDAVSQATPVYDALADVSWPIPDDLAMGNYVMWVEVSKEFDHNATYSAAAYPSPMGIPWSEYGEAYRGQPSVIFKVPFTIGATASTATVTDYAGYGDPDGLSGALNPPDSTITTNVPGSGASRFALIDQGGDTFRVRVNSRPEFDSSQPGVPAQMAVATATSSVATISFVAPGDDGMLGKVKGYEIRYRVNDDITDANFDDPSSIDPKITLDIADPGSLQSFSLDRLLPQTDYSVAIRAFDDCHNTGAITVMKFTTPERAIGEVDACFIATAAYGSVMAADVQMLRHMRDSVLRKSVLGELAIETYYTFGPAVAGVVGESELLRATARDVLAPIVSYVRSFRI
jgi:hypothetical protein